MKVLFDNCTSPVLASTLHGYVAHLGHAAQHIRDSPVGPKATDFAWIDWQQHSKEEWVVITGDGRIQRNRAERMAFRKAMLKGFVLAPSLQRAPQHQIASLLIWRWPEMEG